MVSEAAGRHPMRGATNPCRWSGRGRVPGGALAGYGHVEMPDMDLDNADLDVSETGWVGAPSRAAAEA